MMDDEYWLDDEIEESNWESDTAMWYREGQEEIINEVAEWLADDWHIVSQETLPKVFSCHKDQVKLWDFLQRARQRKLKELQSEVKSLTKKLEKIKAKENKK